MAENEEKGPSTSRLRRSRKVTSYTQPAPDSDDYCSSGSEFKPDADGSASSDEASSVDTSDEGSPSAEVATSGPSKSPVDNPSTAACVEDSTQGKGDKSASDVEKEDTGTNEIVSNDVKVLEHGKTRQNFCCYCNKGVAKVSRHLLSVHKQKPEVQEILQLEPDSPERQKRLEVLRNRGNYLHNDVALKNNSGVLIPKKRGNESCPENLSFCPHCYGTFVKDSLYKHVQRCPNKSKKSFGARSKLIGRKLMSASVNARKKFKEFAIMVLTVMRKDNLYEIVEKDDTIKLYGSNLLSDHIDQPHLITYVSCKCREVARLLKSAVELDPQITNMKCLFDPANWDTLISAVKKEALFDPKGNTYGVPSLAKKFGYSLNVIACYLRAEAVKTKDNTLEDNLSGFSKLYASEWKREVSKKAAKTLYEARFNKEELVPIAEDVVTLYNFLKKKIEICSLELTNNPNPITWSNLCKSSATYILIFNRRRPGELSRIPLSTYLLRKNQQLNEEISNCLSTSEQLLAKSLVLLHIRGKRGRKVPVLLNKVAQSALELLTSHRENGNVKSDSKFVFAIPGRDTSLRLHTCLAEFVKEARLQKPESVTATLLRKHVATTCQVLDLAENEIDQLAAFMGHNLAVHREFYRLPSDAVQLARVSKIFTLLDQGKLTRCEGQSLAAINIDEHQELVLEQSESEEENEPVKTTPKKKRATKNKTRARAHEDEDWEEVEEDLPVKKRIICSSKKRGASAIEVSTKQKKNNGRVSWTDAESSAVKKTFKSFILDGTVPGKAACMKCIDAEPALSRRSWTDVKYYVKNEIDKRRRTGTVSPLKIAAFQRKK